MAEVESQTMFNKTSEFKEDPENRNLFETIFYKQVSGKNDLKYLLKSEP